MRVGLLSIFILSLCETSWSFSRQTDWSVVTGPIPVQLFTKAAGVNRTYGLDSVSYNSRPTMELSSSEVYKPDTQVTFNLFGGLRFSESLFGFASLGNRNLALTLQHDYHVGDETKIAVGAMAGGDSWEILHYGAHITSAHRLEYKPTLLGAEIWFTPFISLQATHGESFMEVKSYDVSYTGTNRIYIDEKVFNGFLGLEFSMVFRDRDPGYGFFLRTGVISSNVYDSEVTSSQFPPNHKRDDGVGSQITLGAIF